MIILIDNYDSFTYNIYHIISKLTNKVIVCRNNEITIKEIIKLKPKAIIISPGPGIPKKAGICIDLIKKTYKKIPILGICLGHQAIGYAFGGKVKISTEIMHGKLSYIYHNNHKIFKNINKNFIATRYHSLIIDNKNFPKELNVIARTKNNIIMGISHKKYKVYGLQFHPESIGTSIGKNIFDNFFKLIK